MNEFLINWLSALLMIVAYVIVLAPMVVLLIKDCFIWACLYLVFIATILPALAQTFL